MKTLIRPSVVLQSQRLMIFKINYRDQQPESCLKQRKHVSFRKSENDKGENDGVITLMGTCGSFFSLLYSQSMIISCLYNMLQNYTRRPSRGCVPCPRLSERSFFFFFWLTVENATSYASPMLVSHMLSFISQMQHSVMHKTDRAEGSLRRKLPKGKKKQFIVSKGYFLFTSSLSFVPFLCLEDYT